MRILFMKVLLMAGFLFWKNLSAIAQIQTRPLKEANIEVVKLNAKYLPKKTIDYINQINVIDSRDDTTSLGYDNYESSTRSKKLVFEQPASKEIMQWVAPAVNLSEVEKQTCKILICIRRLRILHALPAKEYQGKNNPGIKNNSITGITLKMEFYLQRDSSYFPLYKFDSLVTFSQKIAVKPGKYISESLALGIFQLYELNPENYLHKKPLSMQDIINRNERKYPVLFASELKKGIYRDFNEFKNNGPAITNFEFVPGKLADVLFVGEKGHEYPLRKAWGFCDGTNVYINSADKYSKLVRIGNTFYFEGIKNLQAVTGFNPRTNGLNADPVAAASLALVEGAFNRAHYTITLKYYQIDMENGSIQ